MNCLKLLLFKLLLFSSCFIILALRMEVRSSLYRKNDDSHTHTYGEEIYNEENDTYVKTCTTCNHKIEFEKM